MRVRTVKIRPLRTQTVADTDATLGQMRQADCAEVYIAGNLEAIVFVPTAKVIWHFDEGADVKRLERLVEVYADVVVNYGKEQVS